MAWILDCSPMIETTDGIHRDAAGAPVEFDSVESATDYAEDNGLSFHCPTVAR